MYCVKLYYMLVQIYIEKNKDFSTITFPLWIINVLKQICNARLFYIANIIYKKKKTGEEKYIVETNFKNTLATEFSKLEGKDLYEISRTDIDNKSETKKIYKVE